MFLLDNDFDPRRQAGTTATGGKSIWPELRVKLEGQLRHLRDVGGVLDELWKQQQSPLCPKRSAKIIEKTVIAAVFQHLSKYKVIACEQGHATNAGRHYALFASEADANNAHEAIGQQGKVLHRPNQITANRPSLYVYVITV